MALLESIKVPLGSKIPSFKLSDPTGRSYSSSELCGSKGLLIVFTCNHCPYALAVWPRIIRLAEHAKDLGINTVAINPNIHPEYPEDAPEKMIEKTREWGITFPYLVDKSQKIAENFKAQCTPDIYLYNDKLELVYHGRVDDNWKDEAKVKKEELKEAVTNLANGRPVSQKQHPSMGCSIKWR